jgi:putative spermidine/putrescine transport system substrate-binding protein
MQIYRWMMAAAAVTVFATVPFTAPQAQPEVTVVSWGGAYQAAQRKAWFEPAAKELGITIKEDTMSGIADHRAQVMSGSVTWDLVQHGSYSAMKLVKEGMVEKLDFSVINDIGGIPDNMKSDYYIGALVYGLVIGWNTKTYGQDGPKTWKDFYDFKKFPGTRSMRQRADYNLEAALIADGVPMDKLYPLDVDRAFKKLEELKPHVVAWWSSGAASAQLIKDGEIDAIGLWNGRLQNVKKDGAPAELTFNEQMLLFDAWTIPKGAPNKDAAMKVLAHMSKPSSQARLPLFINYSPANQDAYATGIIPKEKLAGLPTSPENVKNSFVYDWGWWMDNYDEMQKRFDEFIQD